MSLRFLHVHHPLATVWEADVSRRGAARGGGAPNHNLIRHPQSKQHDRAAGWGGDRVPPETLQMASRTNQAAPTPAQCQDRAPACQIHSGIRGYTPCNNGPLRNSFSSYICLLSVHFTKYQLRCNSSALQPLPASDVMLSLLSQGLASVLLCQDLHL